jgi:MurNAc alpha-1-phosphate uridylyltransferase
MRAMILAAGRGERMGALTVSTPKPLLQVAGRYLIEYAIASVRRAGIREIVINTAYLGDQIKAAIGNGQRYGVDIAYSEEGERLETGGGIYKALPLLGSDPFLVMSSDIITSHPIASLPAQPQGLAHLVMIANPSFHPQGDYGMKDGWLDTASTPAMTFANMGIYRPELFADCKPGHFRLNTVLLPAVKAKQITGETLRGIWFNVGTPDDLAVVEKYAGVEA